MPAAGAARQVPDLCQVLTDGTSACIRNCEYEDVRMEVVQRIRFRVLWPHVAGRAQFQHFRLMSSGKDSHIGRTHYNITFERWHGGSHLAWQIACASLGRLIDGKWKRP